MKRQHRGGLMALMVLSIVFCLAIAGLWIASYWWLHYFAYTLGAHTYGLANSRGTVSGWVGALGNDPGSWWMQAPNRPFFLDPWALATWDHSFIGFHLYRCDHANGYWDVGFAVPHWFAEVVIAGVLTACRRRLGAPRQAAALCPACGYDLRATPDRCPECGTVPRKIEKVSN